MNDVNNEIEYVTFYLLGKSSENGMVHTIEYNVNDLPFNLNDFMNDLASGGYENFALYSTCSNCGLMGCFGEMKDGEIIYIDDEKDLKELLLG